MTDMQFDQDVKNGGPHSWGRLDANDDKQTGSHRNDTGQALERRGRRARALGWFSVGLGTAQLLVPRHVAKAIGLRPSAQTCTTMRIIGARELLAGIGILRQRRPAGWLWSRVAGDLIDLTLLTRALGSSKKKRRGRLSVAIAMVTGVALLDVVTSRQVSKAIRGAKAAIPVTLTSTITINRSPEDVYAFWRNFYNLTRFMSHVESVQILDDLRSHWELSAPGGKSVDWEATITNDRKNELIAWQTLEGADLTNSGEVRFVRAPGGRGTEVRVRIQVEPPGGALGRTFGKLFRKAPELQLGNDLRRLKQILEVGEVVLSDASVHKGPHPARPSADGDNGGNGDRSRTRQGGGR